jgi:hypothetical protein
MTNATYWAGKKRRQKGPAEDHFTQGWIIRRTVFIVSSSKRPSWTVIDEAVEESGVRGVLVGRCAFI